MERSLEHIEYEEGIEKLARFAKALGHPTRVAILKYLNRQSCCFTGDIVHSSEFSGKRHAGKRELSPSSILPPGSIVLSEVLPGWKRREYGE